MMELGQARFGQTPRGARLERVKKSPNYRDGEFKNLSETPVLTADKGRLRVMMEFLTRKRIRRTPIERIPVVKTDIKATDPDEDILMWFGHSSYFFRIEGKTFLVDPVFNSFASPFPFINRSFKTTGTYTLEDLPGIDYLIITHDHWDHLDYKTVTGLKSKTGHIICGLGTGQHFERWGFDLSIITELDWYEDAELGEGWKITATPARHFSGRGLKANQALWASFVLQAPAYKLFMSGDGGYDGFYKEIGARFGPFDLAVLEQGQYDRNWRFIHMLPGKVFQAARDLNASRILPVHHSKFALANHPWDEPLERITENQSNSGIAVFTPQIGEAVFLDGSKQVFSKWWKQVK